MTNDELSQIKERDRLWVDSPNHVTTPNGGLDRRMLLAEVERLTRELAEAWEWEKQFVAEAQRTHDLEAENARLREALTNLKISANRVRCMEHKDGLRHPLCRLCQLAARSEDAEAALQSIDKV